MQQQVKQLFQRMNLDADVRSLQPGEYRKLTNGITVPPASSSYANALRGVLHSLFGNAIVSYSLPAGTNKCVGFLEDRAGNRCFYFVANSTSSANNSIYQYANGSITLVLRTAYLDFVSTDFVDADIIGDILIFTNRRTDTYKIDVVKAIAGTTYTPLLPEILLIKPPPKLPLTFDDYTVAPDSDAFYDLTIGKNLIAGNHFQFYYRYIYEDYSYSVFSPASRTNYSWSLPSTTAVNRVATQGTVTLSGNQSIDGVNTSPGLRVLLVSQSNPIENGVYVTAAGAWARAADFAAGNSYDLVYYVTSGFSNKGTTWRVTSTNVGTNNTIGIEIEGPNYFRIRRNETPPATVIKIEFAVRTNGSNELFVYKSERVGSFTTTHKFYNDSYIYTVPDTESFKWNDSVPLVSKSLKVFNSRIYLLNNTEGFTNTATGSLTVATTLITPPTSKVYDAANSGGRYNVGIVYTDGYSRISSVIHATAISIPDSFTARYKIRVTTSGITPPSWATHFRIVMTKSLIESFFVCQYTQDIYYYKDEEDGTRTYAKTLSSSFYPDGMAIDIGSLTKKKRGYTFSSGDRIKIYTSIYTSTPSVYDLDIKEQDGRFLYVSIVNGITLSSVQSDNYPFKIYSPKTVTEELYYEVGETYAIASLSAGPYDLPGDVEILNESYYRDNSGDYSPTDPFVNTYEVATSSTNDIEVMNSWNLPIWVTHAGRGLSGLDARQLEKRSYVRFSNPYIEGGNLLGLNTFDALDDNPIKSENGDGVQLADAGDVLVAIYETVTTSLYIGEGFVSTLNTDGFLAKTDQVIGDDRNYVQKFGCQDPATVVSRNGRVYFLDRQKGVILRRSQDGLTIISNYGIRGEISSLCNTHTALGANSRIIGGWDPQYECYVISFINTTGPSGYTYYFHEDSNSWVCLSDLRPDYWGILGNRQIAFTAGALYLQSIETNYNLFFGVQYNRRLEFEISPMQSLEHLWDAIEVDASSIYVTAGTNEDVVLLYHTNGGTLQTRINYLDFQLKAGAYRSSFFRSLNDINFQNSTESKYKSPDQIRGQSAFLVITYNGTDKNVMKSITVFYTPSMNSSP